MKTKKKPVYKAIQVLFSALLSKLYAETSLVSTSVVEQVTAIKEFVSATKEKVGQTVRSIVTNPVLTV